MWWVLEEIKRWLKHVGIPPLHFGINPRMSVVTATNAWRTWWSSRCKSGVGFDSFLLTQGSIAIWFNASSHDCVKTKLPHVSYKTMEQQDWRLGLIYAFVLNVSLFQRWVRCDSWYRRAEGNSVDKAAWLQLTTVVFTLIKYH